MSTNLVETVQRNIGYPPLHKIDPNAQEVKDISTYSIREKLAQAAIPAILAVLYKYTRSEHGRDKILSGDTPRNWLNILLERTEPKAVDKVAHYAGVSRKEAEQAMQEIANEAILVVRADIERPDHETLKKYLGEQRHHILVYLPAVMQLGRLLDDDSLDDRTNKMEGPMSNLMHSIENKFAGGGS
jgi:hypothetical protein